MPKQTLASRVRQAIHANPSKTYAEIAQIVGCSVSTVTKYSPGRNCAMSGVGITTTGGDVTLDAATVPQQPTRPIPLRRVASLLGKGVGRGNVCSPDAPIQIERDETGTTFTLHYVPKTATAAEFFKNFRYLIRVEDTSDNACGSPMTRCTTLADFKDNLADVIGTETNLHPPHDTFDWREPDDARGLWKGDPPAHDDFAEMIEPLEMAGDDPWRPMLRMATIFGGEGPRKGRLLATDSYRLASIRPPQPFAVTGVNLPVPPLQKFLDMTRAAKQTTAPVEMSVGDIETFNARTNAPEVKAPQTTTMRCGNVAVQVTIKPNGLNLGNPFDFPSVDRLFPDDLTDVFEVADAEMITKWIASHNKKKGKDNIAVLTAGLPGEHPTVEMRSLESSASFVSPDGKQGITKTTEWASGSNNKIGFNPEYLADAIRIAGKHSPVSIAMVSGTGSMSPLKPVFVSAKTKPPKTKTEVDMLLMPVRLS